MMADLPAGAIFLTAEMLIRYFKRAMPGDWKLDYERRVRTCGLSHKMFDNLSVFKFRRSGSGRRPGFIPTQRPNAVKIPRTSMAATKIKGDRLRDGRKIHHSSTKT